MTRRPLAGWLQRLSTTDARAKRRCDRAVRALATALESGDEEGARRLLRDDSQLTIDTGGVIRVPATSARGRRAVAEALAALWAANDVAAATSHLVNGAPGLALQRADGRVVAVLTVAMLGASIERLWVVVNPQKLRHWNER